MSALENIRAQFPSLENEVYGKPLVYLDNAATTQRPRSVLDCWQEMSVQMNANIHRAVHKLAVDATAAYEQSREAVRDFIGASRREEIIFTSGTTASINLVATCFSQAFLKAGDEIIIAQSEHHSNIVPWQMACERCGAVIKVLPVDDHGSLRLDMLEGLLSSRTKLLCVAQVSNVLGLRNSVEEIVKICHSKGCLVLVDGAQGIAHGGVDVAALGCDFYAFSGHKMFAATGTGVLYGRKELLEQMPPYMGGGEMIDSVSFEKTTYASLPGKFEAGTQNIAAVPTFVPAIDFIRSCDVPQVRQEQAKIVTTMMDGLIAMGARVYGDAAAEEKLPIFSFTFEGVHHEDLAILLDKMGFALRSGQMCAEPLMDRFGVTGMLRASFAPYNTVAEARDLLEALGRALKMLR